MATSRLFALETLQIPRFIKPEDSIEVLNLPTRLENTLKNKTEKIRRFKRSKKPILTIQDLLEIPDSEIFKFRNIGVNALVFLREIKNRLLEQLKSEAENSEKNGINNNELSILSEKPIGELVEDLLAKCRYERSVEIIKRRYGLLSGEKQTLQEIGDYCGVTRERIRQIQTLSLKRMKKPERDGRFFLIEMAEKVISDNGGILTEEEADKRIRLKYPELLFDGSSIFDLFSDLGWIQRSNIGDLVIYSQSFTGTTLSQLTEKILGIIKNSSNGISATDISDKIKHLKVKDNEFDLVNFIINYCRIDPRIEEINLDPDQPLSSIFRNYIRGGATKRWVFLIKKVLEQGEMPLHVTEIAYKVNDLIKDSAVKIDVRRVWNILIEDNNFAHSGARGTYGLTDWGLRKESTPVLVEECIRKAGFPLHWKQIFEYVSKYKDTKTGNIVSVLKFNKKFKEVRSGSGVYGLAEKEMSDEDRI